MKRDGDMKRRRQAAYRRAWRDAMEAVLAEVGNLVQSGTLPEAAAHELRAVCNTPPLPFPGAAPAPEPSEKSDWKGLPPVVEPRRRFIAAPNSAPHRGAKR